ncbi:MAG TPA: hypothetical protein VHR41_19545 [Gemmatimonadales bacterium]|jgi:hypothetical protein|nr:hypothetical protein [Gemmatimonadales bacterium]
MRRSAGSRALALALAALAAAAAPLWSQVSVTSPDGRNQVTPSLRAITDEERLAFDVPLSFLTPGKRYVASPAGR